MSFKLANGFRTHILPNDSGYVSVTLVLRSKEIVHERGLAHLMEHTSFSGAAGSLSAKEIKERHQAAVQDSNASTEPGTIQWDLCFLPHYLPQVLELLSLTSLDQKFDVETVAQEARIVLQELYLDKYDANAQAQQKFNIALFGSAHPYVRETIDGEIATAKMAPERLAIELRQYSAGIKLPANMDLFLVGEVDPERTKELVEAYFGRYAYAQGPLLQIPNVGVTHAYRALDGRSRELKQPLCQLKMAWNTGVRLTDPEAPTLVALSEYLNTILFKRLREEQGDSYSPEASYEPDGCSGIFKIVIPSSKDPAEVEGRTFAAIQAMKSYIDASELGRFKDRVELKRRRKARSNEDLIDRLVQRTVEGIAVDDLAPETVTRDQLLAAARHYLPEHRGAYVRLALKGE